MTLTEKRQKCAYSIEISNWIRSFLAKPHPDLGRPGIVCPFIPKALQLDSIQIIVIHTKGLEQQQIEETVRGYRSVFLQQEHWQEELKLYKALILVFPDVLQEENFKLIDEVQRKLKPFFVEAGLMLGEFHPQNQRAGLHNPHFRPLRSPIPLLAIRFMVDADLPFLSYSTDQPDLRIRYLQAYLQQMETQTKDQRQLGKARTALALAKTQFEQSRYDSIQKPSRCPFARLTNVFRVLGNVLHLLMT